MRYGVIGFDELKRDMQHWETLLVSSMMQRPINTLKSNDEISEL